MNLLRALLLIPAGFLGAFTALSMTMGHRTRVEVVVEVVVLATIGLAHAAVLAIMWRGPPGRRYLGLPREAWATMLLLSCAAGAAAMLAG